MKKTLLVIGLKLGEVLAGSVCLAAMLGIICGVLWLIATFGLGGIIWRVAVITFLGALTSVVGIGLIRAIRDWINWNCGIADRILRNREGK